jgi:hypothetical protein
VNDDDTPLLMSETFQWWGGRGGAGQNEQTRLGLEATTLPDFGCPVPVEH